MDKTCEAKIQGNVTGHRTNSTRRSPSAYPANFAVTDLSMLSQMAGAYWGDRGVFAYRAYEWANDYLFRGRIPTPLIQWALTPHGACLGMTATNPDRPVVTLHPSIWDRTGAWNGAPAGRAYTLDVIIHELLHAYVACLIQDGEPPLKPSQTSHNNLLWPREVVRVSPLIGLGNVVAAPTKRKRSDGRMLRVPAVEGAITMAHLATWPHSIRPAAYHEEGEIPFTV